MTDHDLGVARDIGSLQADMRTVKHDVVQVSMKIDVLSNLITKLGNSQARGLGFFAGAAFILTACGGFLFALGKVIFGEHA